MHRRTLFAATLLPLPALAQDRYPTRPIRVVVPFAVGGITDVVARVMAEPMSITLGRPLVIDNQGGAGSTIGAAVVGRAAPDGYSIMVGSVGHTVMDVLYPAFPFKPALDFVPVALLGRQPFVVAVHPSIPATNIAAFLDWMRAKRGEANFGTAGIGSTSHLSAALLKTMAGTDFTVVPYRGTPQAVTDLTAGRVDFMVDSQTLLAPLIADGRVRGLAVTTPVRSRLLPDLPTLNEAGVAGYDASAWQAIYVPAGTPLPIREALEAAALRGLADPAIQRRLGEIGVDPFADGSAAAAQAYLGAEVTKWAALVRAAGIRGG